MPMLLSEILLRIYRVQLAVINPTRKKGQLRVRVFTGQHNQSIIRWLWKKNWRLDAWTAGKMDSRKGHVDCVYTSRTQTNSRSVFYVMTQGDSTQRDVSDQSD